MSTCLRASCDQAAPPPWLSTSNSIAATHDIPPLGLLSINSFVVHGTEPLLVDTGTVAGRADFLAALGSVIDPQALRWIWLTHTDFDHIGSLTTLLELNPRI